MTLIFIFDPAKVLPSKAGMESFWGLSPLSSKARLSLPSVRTSMVLGPVCAMGPVKTFAALAMAAITGDLFHGTNSPF